MSKRILTLLFLVHSLLSYAQAEKVIFSAPGGFYEDSFQLSLDCFYANHHIRYTTNGSTPTSHSACYHEPLTLNQQMHSQSDIYTIVNCIPSIYHHTDSVRHAIVIRAAVFDENEKCISEVSTNSYFIHSLGCDTYGLPVLSIATDSLSLFDYETGIFIPGAHYNPSDSTHTGNYFETGKAWERLVNMEFYELDNKGVNQLCGLRIHGGASRWFQQKGMRLYARDEYGKKKFTHRFFESTPIKKFKHLNLHPFRCSNWLQTGGQEYLSQTVAATLNVDAMGVRQTAVYINGEYWGIYTLEESPDERYIESHYDADPDQVNILKYWGVPQNGDPTDWRRFYSWIENADLSQAEDSAYAFSRIDVPSFIDYILLELYAANLDWPQNNVLHWQAETGAPFRWLFYDGDGCFTEAEYNAFDHAINIGGCRIVLSQLLKNKFFRNNFYLRYIQLLNSSFSYHYLRTVLEEYRQIVEDAIPWQIERFGFPESVTQWNEDMEKAVSFFLNRNTYFKHEILNYTSDDENLSIHFSCVPNPTPKDFKIIIHSNDNAILPLRIYDILGRLVLSKELYLSGAENSIHLQTNLAPGLYLISVGEQTSRLVIK